VKVTNEKTEDRQAFLTIEMEPTEVEQSLEESYHRLAKKANIPGFRKGKAPRAILERYIDKESLLEDALNRLVPQAYEKALKEQEIEAIARPQLEVTQTDPVVFKAIVPLKPIIELGNYHDTRVSPEPVELTENDVSNTIEQLRHRYATWEPVERPVDFNDLVVLDIESNIEGEPFVNQKGVQYQVLRDLPFPVPGFAEQLPGMAGGEEKDFVLQLPTDYPRSDLAGKKPSFKVRINEIKQEQLPELDDEFARAINPDFKTLDLLREQVSADLKHRAEEKAKIDLQERVIEAVIELAQVEFPPILVETESDWLLSQQLRHWQMSGKGLEDYLKSVNKTEQELREELHPLATKRVTRSLVLGKVAEEEKIEVSDAEIDTEIDNMIKSATENQGELQKFLKTPQARESIRQTLTIQKTVERLVEIAAPKEYNGK